MTNGQLNYLRMIVTSRGVLELDSYASIWSGNALVVAAKGNVDTLFGQILSNAGITESDLKGITQTKEQLWHDTAFLGVHLNIGVKAWAENQVPAQAVLAGEMHYTQTDLGTGAIQEALNKMNFIAGKVGVIPTLELPDVNIDAGEITLFGTMLTKLTEIAPQFRTQQSVKTAATSDIASDFKLLKAAKKKQDNLIHTYKYTKKTFVEAYDNASKIIDLGKGAKTAEALMHPMEHVAWFHNEYLPGDTLTLRNHSVLAKIKAYLSDGTDVPATGGFEIGPEKEFQLEIPKGFNGPFGHYIIIENMSGTDDAQVTGILARGKSESGAPVPPL